MIDKLPFLSDEHHYAIAAVATRAAQLDAHIEMSIWSILTFAKLSGTSKYVLKNMNGDRYVGLLRELLLDELPNLSEQINSGFDQISALRTERNEILHWLYGKADDPAIAKSSSVRPHRPIKEKFRTALEMQKVAEDFLEYAILIVGWTDLARKNRDPLALQSL